MAAVPETEKRIGSVWATDWANGFMAVEPKSGASAIPPHPHGKTEKGIDISIVLRVSMFVKTGEP
ncbi:hypothetical protein M655_025150 [Brevibacillus sp. NSP2.1]|uniref:hypothetical protein n=1 Tax=Brevibacillus sp. NSP2.1 TaxID=3003229 RepID=UPI0012663942|nr:hypothetical protein [Brevibacillus sp. NSP2.1]QHZ58658.1 hypothetical protein M655_025150 [Brevibacillus sp. NSP2.1]